MLFGLLDPHRGCAAPVRAAGPSEIGKSEIGKSEIGQSEIGQSEIAESQSISEIQLVPDGQGPGQDHSIRLTQVGNPARRPVLPDLSREGVHELPGRVSLEVPDQGLLWGDRWLPPGIYRLALVTDGFAIRLRARPLAPGRDLELPVETGTLTAPAAQFRAHLGVRQVDRDRSGYLSLRWGVLLLEATLTSPDPSVKRVADWVLRAVPIPSHLTEEVFIGTLDRSSDGSGLREVRWIREGGESHLRLELSRRRRLIATHREYVARAERLHTVAKGLLDGGEESASSRVGLTAESYEERAAQIERQLEALDGSGRELVGTLRPPAGERLEVRLESLEGAVRLVIDGPDGGVEFRLP